MVELNTNHIFINLVPLLCVCMFLFFNGHLVLLEEGDTDEDDANVSLHFLT